MRCCMIATLCLRKSMRTKYICFFYKLQRPAKLLQQDHRLGRSVGHVAAVNAARVFRHGWVQAKDLGGYIKTAHLSGQSGNH